MSTRPLSRTSRLTRLTAATAIAALAACAPDSSISAPDVDGTALMSAADAMAAVQAGPPQYVEGELLIQFKENASANGRGRALGKVNGREVEDILTPAMKARGKKVGLSRVVIGTDINSALTSLRTEPDVEYAEPNWIYQHAATSNDTYYINGSLWGMYGSSTTPVNQYGTGAGTAWANNKTGSSSVWVGIIDEGYMYDHEDLAANAGKNPYETAGNGVDDDGNGLIDDVYGWDFAGNNASVFDGIADDHGTHVAGTIGAVGGNGKGVAGVVWNVKLMNAKFLGSNGGTTANAIKAVDYFTNLKNKGLNLVATSNSWGGGGFSQALQDAIERANTAGVLFIAAAGNSALNCDTGSSCYPAEYPNSNIVAVASITSTGAMSSFSNYGATTIDLGAPGSAVWSTVPVRKGNKMASGYASYSGTSMATPHVSGAAALYKSLNPIASAATIKAALLNGTATPSLAGKTASGKRLNVSTY